MATEEPVQMIDVKSLDADMPEVDIRPGVPENKQRPVSAVSRTSTSSVTSNIKRAQGVMISKYTIESFYSHREGAFASAVSECKTSVLKPEDGQLLGSWLLTEIDQWDCEQEKLVLLAENTLHIVRYDWVKNRLYSSKAMELKDIKLIKSGDLKYPSMSLMPEREHGAVRICTDSEDSAGFFSRWNFAGAAGMPYWTFSHHRLSYADGESESSNYNVDDFHDSLLQQVQEIYRTKKAGEEAVLKAVEEDIIVYTYASLTSAIYNQSSLGFSKDRRGINY